jgi:uncharacterized protein Yka (UPF0111/DUF47 family)
MNPENFDNLTEEELFQLVSKRIKEAYSLTCKTVEHLDKMLKELPKERGLKAILKHPERYADIIEDLELAAIVKERENQPKIEVNVNDL